MTTQTSAAATIDTGTSQSVTFGTSSTTASVTVGQTLTFTNNTPSFALAVDPTGLTSRRAGRHAHRADQRLERLYADGLRRRPDKTSGTTYTIPAATTARHGVATFPPMALASGGGRAAAAPTVPPWQTASVATMGRYGAATPVLTTTGPTGATADTLALTNQVAVNYSVPAGPYSDTITYVATPTY